MIGRHRNRHRDRSEQVLEIDDGEVVCPRRGIVDLELCFLCPRFRGFEEGVTERLVCAYESVHGLPDFSWAVDTSIGPLDRVR